MFWKVLRHPRVGIDVVVVEPFEIRHLAAGLGEGEHAFARLVETGDAVEDRGLAGAVRPDQRGDVVPPDGEGDVVDGGEAAEPHGEMLDLEQGIVLPGLHPRPSLTRSPLIEDALPSVIDGSRVPTMPRGRQIMIATMATPNSSMR